jgi:hypothetical protein
VARLVNMEYCLIPVSLIGGLIVPFTDVFMRY